MDEKLDIAKPWREIVDPVGTTISQVKRYVAKEISEIIETICSSCSVAL